MLGRWSSFVYRRRRIVLALAAVSLVAAILLLALGAGSLSSSGFVNRGSESERVADRLAGEFGRGREQLVFVFDGSSAAADPDARRTIEAALAPVAADSRVARVLTYWNTGNPAFVSKDGRSTYAVALLNVTDDDALTTMDDLAAIVRARVKPAGYTVSLGGFPAVDRDIANEVEQGIVRAESVSVPLTILIQLLVFGTLVAAGLPLLVGGLATVGAIATILLLANVTDQSVFAVNIITMLGLALGVDYSLFMVARFREELRHSETEPALGRTLQTTGKAILFSGATVVFGLAATFFFPLPALHSMGLAGMIVVSLAVIYGLTFLPALLAIAGPRIDALAIPGRRRSTQPAAESRFWATITSAVMRRPARVLTAVLALLLLAGLPFLRLSLTPGGTDVLPADAPSRIVAERLNTDFPADESESIPVLLTVAGGPLTSSGFASLQQFIATTRALPHVIRVESFLTEQAAANVDWAAIADGKHALSPQAQALTQGSVSGNTALVYVVTDLDVTSQRSLVRHIRGIPVSDGSVQVGGSAATAVDTIAGIKAGLPVALLFVIVGSYLILLLTFGSLVLPLKAIVMTLLSISASLGTLVFVFQDGRLENLLGFTASGQIISTTPILMFCILFGLSMDYEVLMLTRIQEEYQRTGDNAAAVAFGLQRTARVITSAAAIMVVAFGAFMLADIVIIKSLGFGLTLAVLIDATIVRALLVPATMRLLGDWNWWAPRPVKAVVDRLGLSHIDLPTPRPALSRSAAD